MPVAIQSPRCLNLNQKCFLALPTSMGETTPGLELSYCCGWNSPLPQFQLRLDSSKSNLSSCLLRPAHLYSTLGCSAFFFGSFESSQPSIRNPFIMVSFTWVLLVCATCFWLRPHCSKVCHANGCLVLSMIFTGGSSQISVFMSMNCCHWSDQERCDNLCQKNTGPEIWKPGLSQPKPMFQLTFLDGKSIDATDSGKMTLMNFT